MYTSEDYLWHQYIINIILYIRVYQKYFRFYRSLLQSLFYVNFKKLWHIFALFISIHKHSKHVFTNTRLPFHPVFYQTFCNLLIWLFYSLSGYLLFLKSFLYEWLIWLVMSLSITWPEDMLSIIVLIIINGISNTSSNPGQGCLYFHHHHVVPSAQISLTLSCHPSISSIVSGRSSRLHPVLTLLYVGSSYSSCLCLSMWGGSLMSSSLLLQRCPACLVRLTWIVFMMGGKWPYSCWFVGCCLHDLFNIAHSILV